MAWAANASFKRRCRDASRRGSRDFRFVTIALMLVLSITGSLLAFDQFFILTRGGPDGSTVSIVMVIYREAFTKFNLGLGAAISVLLLFALVLLHILQLRVLKRGE